ncbi:DUF1707 and DUF4870 domain-containing protein [Granulicoccus phenolivorans]|uniref:DUF1707 and DUF4870 domain-containing protein n=1 Tax=Granulicoccus phenolivorans TaxID=266854 RepID=UPI00041C800A|nr:DUF1707 and DUF4870 domain-containing protein [Granulicoccus phenolivorans]
MSTHDYANPHSTDPQSSFPQYADYGQQTTPISTAERDRAVDMISQAYAEGRLNETELDARLNQVMTAQTRPELNQALYGLVDPYRDTYAAGYPQADPYAGYQPGYPAYRATDPSGYAPTGQHLAPYGQLSQSERTGAGLTHLSGLAAGPVVPAIVYFTSDRGSVLRAEAAQAFNFQLFGVFATIAMAIIGGIVDLPLAGIVGLAWFILTVISAVKAFQGERWENPVTKRINWKPLRG